MGQRRDRGSGRLISGRVNQKDGKCCDCGSDGSADNTTDRIPKARYRRRPRTRSCSYDEDNNRTLSSQRQRRISSSSGNASAATARNWLAAFLSCALLVVMHRLASSSHRWGRIGHRLILLHKLVADQVPLLTALVHSFPIPIQNDRRRQRHQHRGSASKSTTKSTSTSAARFLCSSSEASAASASALASATTATDIQDVNGADSNDRSSSNSDDRNAGRTTKSRLSGPPPPPLMEPRDFPRWAYEPRDFFRFEVLHQSRKPGSMARVGRIHTPHGVIDTPGFVAVATNGALKGVDWRDAQRAHQQLVFCNTYHLMIHPGADLIEEAGGLHKFTRHAGPIITDSGGFQVFSLAHGSVHEDLASQGKDNEQGELKQRRQRRRGTSGDDATTTSNSNSNTKMVKVTEDGVWFKSYRDGSQFLLTPESTVLAQKQLGADIIIPLDELPGYYTDRLKLQESLHRTHRWEGRSLHTHLQQVDQQAMYCVIHGGIDRELRTESVDYLTSLPFDGHAIGGSLGNGRQELKELLEFLMPQLDSTADRRSKPRHLLGIADEESILNAVPFGVDTLDSCYPTRVARHGTILTRTGSIKIGSGKYGRQYGIPLDDKCQCSTCQHYDRSYLWHLFKAKEPLAISLATIHNLHYMNDLMKSLRDNIYNDEV